MGILKEGFSAYSSPVMLISRKLTKDKRVHTDKIITLYHKSLFAGHQGVIKTYLTISDKFLYLI